MNLSRLKSFLKRAFLKFSPNHTWHAKDPQLPLDKKKTKWMIKNGFYPTDVLLFDFEKFGMENYLKPRDYVKIHPINGPFSALIDNKAFLPVLLQFQPNLIPDLFVYLSNGKMKFSRGISSTDLTLENLLKAALEKFDALIAKPTGGSGGRNILKITQSNLNEAVDKLKKGDYVVNNFLENDTFSKSIYPHSLNTLRVIFYKNQNQKNTILMIGHRFGNSASKEVDNISSGGLACSVDIETGRLSKAYSYLFEGYRGWNPRHMDTGAMIENVTIPDWNSKLQQIHQLITSLDFLDYAGIDIAFTNKGLKVIEINSLPGTKLMQITKPALLDEEFKKFILSKGYQKK